MSYLIVSDIHGNSDALMAVLEDAKKHADIETILCLGDTAGYAAEPDVCIFIARKLGFMSVKGNHDLAVSGAMETDDFNGAAAEAAAWQKAHLSTADRQWLKQLPLTLEYKDFTLAHGSPRDPVWEYVADRAQAAANFAHFTTRFCLVGHTHCPVYFTDRGNTTQKRLFTAGVPVKLEARTLMNPGSVGQPRDGDPRASYLIWDNQKKEVCNYRVAYDVKTAQAKIRQEGLPEMLASRLASGW